MPSLKPVNEREVADFCFRHNAVVTVENHQIVTGLGSLVSEIVGDIGGGPPISVLVSLTAGRQVVLYPSFGPNLGWMHRRWPNAEVLV